jgi:hypothetical protein
VLRLAEINRLLPVQAAAVLRLAEVELALPGLERLALSGAPEHTRSFAQAIALQADLKRVYLESGPNSRTPNNPVSPAAADGQPIPGTQPSPQSPPSASDQSIKRGKQLLGLVSVSSKNLDTSSLDSLLDNVFRLVDANSGDAGKVDDIANAFRSIVEQWRAGYVELASSVMNRVQDRLRAKDPGFRFVNLNSVSDEQLQEARASASAIFAAVPLETPHKTDKFIDNRLPLNKLIADPVLATVFTEMLREQISTRAEKWNQAVGVVNARADLVGRPFWNPRVDLAFDGKPRLAVFVADDQPRDSERLRSLNRFASYYGDSVGRVSLLDGILPRMLSNQPLILVGHHVSMPNSIYFAGPSGLSVNFEPGRPAPQETWQSRLDKPNSGLLDARTVGLYLNAKGVSPDYIMLVSCGAGKVARQLALTVNRPVVTFDNDVAVGHLGRLVAVNAQPLTIRLYIPVSADKATQRLTPSPAARSPNTFRDFLRLTEAERQALGQPSADGGSVTEVRIDIANPRAITIEQLDELVRQQLSRWRTRGL